MLKFVPEINSESQSNEKFMKSQHCLSFSVLLVAFVFFGIGCKSQSANNGTTVTIVEPVKKENESNKSSMVGQTNVKVRVSTPHGEMVIRLYDETPQHRDNFIKLVESGFYNDLLFHRCIKGFMAQGGDPNSKGAPAGQQLGMGGPGYTVPAEFNSEFIHKKGALAAARQGDFVNPSKSSSGSQFYIVQGVTMTDAQINQVEKYVQQKNPAFKYSESQREIYKTIGGTAQLDMDYTVFGEIVSGLEVVDKILTQPVGPGDRPVDDITMKMEIVSE
ncbi:MAG: peptidylprolyl isomerase [Bacteroidota bacterium]